MWDGGEAYRAVQVLVIAWARAPHVGYWHSSGLEPKGRADNCGVAQEKPMQ